MIRPQSRSDVPWVRRQEIPGQQIINAADQFLVASELLSREPLGSGVLLPIINTAAVSIELYLKGLGAERIYIEDAEMPEMSSVSARAQIIDHALTKLFAAIPDEVRAQMVVAYDAQLRLKSEDDFETTLGKIKGAFAASRYPFEPGVDITKYSSTQLVDVAKFLRAFVKSMPVQHSIEWRQPDA
jgi:hypothetical protein